MFFFLLFFEEYKLCNSSSIKLAMISDEVKFLFIFTVNKKESSFCLRKQAFPKSNCVIMIIKQGKICLLSNKIDREIYFVCRSIFFYFLYLYSLGIILIFVLYSLERIWSQIKLEKFYETLWSKVKQLSYNIFL